MNKDNTFKLHFDEHPMDSIERLGKILEQYGIKLKELEPEEGAEYLEYEVIKNDNEESTKEETKGYIVEIGHNSGYESGTFVKSYDKAVNEVHEFFLSYDFKIVNGMPFDDGNDDGGSGGFDIFGDARQWTVIEHNGEFKVTRFIHCDGDGPVGSFREND